MFKRTSLGAVVTLSLLASMALAQPPGGRGGRGGFGFGFGRNQATAMGLLRIDEVREELKITDDQSERVDTVLDEARDAMRQGVNFGDLQNLSDEERQERFAEIQERSEQVAKETEEKLAGILQAEQMQRLQQLKLQREGISALVREEVAKQLELSEDQQQKLRELQQSSARPRGQAANFQDMTPEERREYFNELREQREKAEADMLAVLSDQQRQKWQEMQGEPFDFPRGGGFGGRGGGGRGFGGGRGGASN